MKHELLSLLSLLLPALHAALAIVPCSTFAQYTRGGRSLLLFSPSWEDPRFLAQNHLLYAHSEPDTRFSDYDLHVVSMPLPYSFGLVLLEDVDALRARFHIDPADFTVILLDRDGSEMLRHAAPVSLELITTLIDGR